MHKNQTLQERAINTIRFLAADGVQKANSGHPGLPMGTAAMAYTLWMRHLHHSPSNPAWSNRDRFVLSGGHGSMLLYALLHLTGYGLPLDELKNFRQWGSRTPGHPEYGWTVGVETTTGPLGQGFSTGVGMAIAEAHLATVFNRAGFPVVDHYTYAIVTDGDLMEGVSSEAASLAGHLRLGKLIYLYDDNRISIDGSTDIAFTEDRAARFRAYDWHVQQVADGNDVEAIDAAIQAAQADPRPSLIVCRTHIGYGMPHKQDTSKAHGEPPGEEELAAAKDNLGWPQQPRFYIPDDVQEHFRESIARGKEWEAKWQSRFESYRAEHPDLAAEFERRLRGEFPKDWLSALPTFPADDKGMASRAASGKVINALAGVLPELIGGSADLAPSTKTWINSSPAFQPDTRQGRNFHFGVREHAMGAALNGLVLHGGVIPYGGTFLVFSDYMRGAMRVAALSHIAPIWVFTHDSIGLGEDGPTHQPVEHLAALRAMPNVTVIRPADANETVQAWQAALLRRTSPTALIFSRQTLPTLDREVYASAEGTQRGAYVLADLGEKSPEIILMASGSEVGLIVTAGARLAAEGMNVRLVSFPSWELFDEQEQSYRDQVLPPEITTRLAVEAGISQGWHRWVGNRGGMITLDRYGASAPAKILFDKFGFTVENVIARAQDLMANKK